MSKGIIIRSKTNKGYESIIQSLRQDSQESTINKLMAQRVFKKSIIMHEEGESSSITIKIVINKDFRDKISNDMLIRETTHILESNNRSIKDIDFELLVDENE